MLTWRASRPRIGPVEATSPKSTDSVQRSTAAVSSSCPTFADAVQNKFEFSSALSYLKRIILNIV